MHILLHAGVHATDEDRLIKCLLKNTALLSAEGVAVPGPSRYRRLLRDTLQAMGDGSPSPDAREILLETILEGETPDRMILSNDNFFGVPRFAVGKGVFLVPEDRKGNGILLDLPIAENVSLPNLPAYTRALLVSRAMENRQAEKSRSDLAIKAPTVATRTGSLSGGTSRRSCWPSGCNAKPT
jgi:hypothetical protein